MSETPLRVTKDSWKTRPLPESRTQIPFKRAFSPAEYEQVRAGFLPKEMEDKWFIYYDCRSDRSTAAPAALREQSTAAPAALREQSTAAPAALREPEGEWLYFHRSWTGICIYAARLLPIGDGYRVREAWANRDPAEYRMTDDQYDADLLHFLIDSILLGKSDVERPVSPVQR